MGGIRVKLRLPVFSALAALTVAAAACSRPGTDERAFEWSTPLPPGAVLHLRNGSGNITVRRGTGPTAVVTGARRWRRGRARDVRFVVTQMGKDYFVCAMWRNSGRCAANGYRGKNTGGFLTLFSLLHRSTDATADITAELPPNVPVDASTSNGSVSIDGTSGSVIAHTLNGNLDVTNVAGPLALSTTNGNVHLSTDSIADNDSIHVTTTNGVIKAEVPASLQGSFDLSVVNGVVKSDLPIAAMKAGRHLQGQIGSSSRIVKMRAVNGTVSVMARPAPATH
jgi:hypothetical protein